MQIIKNGSIVFHEVLDQFDYSSSVFNEYLHDLALMRDDLQFSNDRHQRLA